MIDKYSPLSRTGSSRSISAILDAIWVNWFFFDVKFSLSSSVSSGLEEMLK
jgi:hypothetical protein